MPEKMMNSGANPIADSFGNAMKSRKAKEIDVSVKDTPVKGEVDTEAFRGRIVAVDLEALAEAMIETMAPEKIEEVLAMAEAAAPETGYAEPEAMMPETMPV